MRLKITHLVTVVMLFLVSTVCSMGQIPVVSTDGVEEWYFIETTGRNASNPDAKFLAGAPDGALLPIVPFSDSDILRWKVVAKGAGYALINKEYGTYMNTDQTWKGSINESRIYMSEVAPNTAVKFVPTALFPNGVFIVDVGAEVSAENVVNNSTLSFCYYNGNGNMSSSYIIASSLPAAVAFKQPKDLLRDAIGTVRTTLENVSVGFEPGQYSNESLQIMNDTLVLVEAVYNDITTSDSEFLIIAGELLASHKHFKSKIIVPLISTPTQLKWYLIQGTRPVNSYLTATGSGTVVRSMSLISDDTQLWRLVANPTGGFALQNKATNEYINTNLISNTVLPTQVDLPQNGLRCIVSTQYTNKVARFWIENEVGSTPALRLHAGAATTQYPLMNWTGNALDNSSWLFLDYREGLKYNKQTAITEAQQLYDNSVEGDIIGQYSRATREALLAVVEAAQEVEMDAMTDAELIETTAELRAAIDIFVCNTDITTLESPTPQKNYRWFRIVSAATSELFRNKAISSRGRVEGEKLTYETIDVEADQQLFRFDLNESGTAVRAIVNKASSMYMAGNGAIAAEFPAVDFEVTALDGSSFWIKPVGLNPIHATGSHIINWNAGAGSASAWKLVYVMDSTNDAPLNEERTITVGSAQPSKGTAVITGTSDTAITTNARRVSLTAIPTNAVFFVCWTNAAGDTLSVINPYVYEGEEDIEIFANFEDAYYRPMTRIYTSVSPAIQSEDRYLESVWVNIGEVKQTIFTGVSLNPLPIDASVAQNQVLEEAIVDYTNKPMLIPAGTDSIEVVFKAQDREATVENLQWTQQIVYIDWDKDFSFLGDNERTDINAGSLINPEGYSRKLAISDALAQGAYRMRVVYHDAISGEDWGVAIWSDSRVRNGIVYDFTLLYGDNPILKTEHNAVKPLSVRVINSVVTIENNNDFELYSLAGQRLDNKQSLKSGVYIVKAGASIEKVIVN